MPWRWIVDARIDDETAARLRAFDRTATERTLAQRLAQVARDAAAEDAADTRRLLGIGRRRRRRTRCGRPARWAPRTKPT
ncbi:MAG TPA: hypothetical protein PKE15_00225 [Ottowia sp.]|nr:hypothetical protein [Ottowia sp.]